MSSSSSCNNQFNPRANVFILVNLGCEMLYVIDQRLKAQQIAEEKSIQVIHDITAVLLEPKFIDSLMIGSTHGNSQLLTAEHCKFMLNDIATCSLMRLDENSMDKLWNLMTIIYKWQLFVSKHQHHLLDITFRHLDSIGKLYPDAKRSMLVDFTKNTLLDFWNASGDDGQLSIYRTNKSWLQCFNTKISLLIRLGFQASGDGSFLREVNESYYREFAESIGENIYIKSMEIAEQRKSEVDSVVGSSSTRRVDQLAELLNFQPANNDDLKPINATLFQKQFEQNLQQCNILFDDLDVNSGKQKSSGGSGEFVQLQPVYTRNSETSSGSCSGSKGLLKKDLLDLYSKMN